MDTNPGIPLRKMNGLGNDFAVLDLRTRPRRFTAEEVRRVADRETGIVCDQVIAIEASPAGADAFMRICNADGGEVGACGNAARCLPRVLARELGRPGVTLETAAGLLGAVVHADGTVTVDMGRPRLRWDEIPLSEQFHDTRYIELQLGPADNPALHSPSVVNVGNPHCLFWVDDVGAHDLARIGPLLEHHPLFPEGANISLAALTGPDAIALRTWERGAGLTRACGSAACAAAVAAQRKRLTGRKVTVTLPGGPLRLYWRESDDHILMTGPGELDWEGVLDPALLEPETAA
jgi:diaminopimelate epimerase